MKAPPAALIRPPAAGPGEPAAAARRNTGARGAVDLLFKGVEALMAALLIGMVAMVLGNVVLRYGFDTGIAESEELSRSFFVWLTFIGAVVAARDGTHLSVDSLARKLTRPAATALAVVRELLVIGCCVLLFAGCWQQHQINASTASLVTGMPLIWVFGIVYVMSGGIALVSLHTLWRIATSRAGERELLGTNPAQGGEGEL